MNAARIDRDAVRAAADVRHVARVLGVRIAQATGERWSIHCPNAGAHRNADANPSASLWSFGWKCHACGEGGDVFGLVALVEGLDVKRDFRAVLARTAELVGAAGDPGHVAAPTAASRAPDKPPEAYDPGEARRRVMAALWGVLDGAPFGDAARAWCDARGLDVVTVHDAGVRDPGPVLGEIVDVLRGFTADELEASGLAKHGKWWLPLARLRDGVDDFAGVLVPVFVAGEAAPMAWRWRYVEKPPGQKKVFATWAGVGNPPAVLGLRFPARSYHPGFGTRPVVLEDGVTVDPVTFGQTLRAPASAGVVVVVDGEPDWLSVLDAAQRLNLHDVACVGLVATSSIRIEQWGGLLTGAERVVVMVHDDGGTGARTAQAIANDLVRRVGIERARSMFVRRLVTDASNDDLNDLHQRGELVGTLAGALHEACSDGA